jgi:C4-dicarboxylate-specific signal transduction histidine kinase
MKRKIKTLPAMDAIERDFMDALDRLEANTPTNAELIKLAKLGTLKINVLAVAKEAGHSRTLIGHNGCKYPRVRARIIGLKTPVEPALTAEAVINRLRQENAELRQKITQRDSENAALVLRLRQLEIATQRELRKAKRATNRQSVHPDKLAGSGFQSENGEVLPFPAPQEE